LGRPVRTKGEFMRCPGEGEAPEKGTWPLAVPLFCPWLSTLVLFPLPTQNTALLKGEVWKRGKAQKKLRQAFFCLSQPLLMNNLFLYFMQTRVGQVYALSH
jgi:hypothetical protein